MNPIIDDALAQVCTALERGTMAVRDVDRLRAAFGRVDAQLSALRRSIDGKATKGAPRLDAVDELRAPSTHRAGRRAAEHFAAGGGNGNPWPAPVKRETIADRRFAFDVESKYAHLGPDVVEAAHRLRDEHRQLVEKAGTNISLDRYVQVGVQRLIDAEERQAAARRTADRGAAELERHRKNSAWTLPGDPQN